MEAEVVTNIAELAEKAAGPVIVQPPAEPKHVYLLRGPDGTYTRTEADIQPTAAAALTLETIAALSGESSQVWVAPDRVVLLPAGPGSRDRVAMPLRESKPLALLRQWNQTPPRLTQADLIRVLRTTLADAIAGNPGVLTKVRKVNLQKNTQVQSEQGRGRVSVDRSILAEAVGMDRSILAEAVGMDDLPDDLVFTVPLFEHPVLPNQTVAVRCAFEIDPAAERFNLDILPGEIAAADADAVRVVTNLIAAHAQELGLAPSIYAGRPE